MSEQGKPLATYEETVALAKEVGIREAARRTGHSKSTVERWLNKGPPQPPTPRESWRGPKHSVASNASAEGTKQGEGGGAGVPAGVPSTRATPGTEGTPGDEPATRWNPGWRRKSDRIAEVVTNAPLRLTELPRAEDVPRDPRLTDAQNIVVHLLLTGYHAEEISKAMGISPWQLLAWRRDPTFRQVFQAGVDHIRAIVLEEGAAFGAIAVDEMYRIGMNAAVMPHARVMALRAYAYANGYGPQKRIEPPKTGGTVGLPGASEDELEEEERKAEEELRLLQGGRS